jgi:hypothetical protein
MEKHGLGGVSGSLPSEKARVGAMISAVDMLNSRVQKMLDNLDSEIKAQVAQDSFETDDQIATRKHGVRDGEAKEAR